MSFHRAVMWLILIMCIGLSLKGLMNREYPGCPPGGLTVVRNYERCLVTNKCVTTIEEVAEYHRYVKECK